MVAESVAVWLLSLSKHHTSPYLTKNGNFPLVRIHILAPPFDFAQDDLGL